MEIRVQISTFSFSGFQLRFYRLHLFHPNSRFKHSDWWRHNIYI